jgi:hypothetical protein
MVFYHALSLRFGVCQLDNWTTGTRGYFYVGSPGSIVRRRQGDIVKLCNNSRSCLIEWKEFLSNNHYDKSIMCRQKKKFPGAIIDVHQTSFKFTSSDLRSLVNNNFTISNPKIILVFAVNNKDSLKIILRSSHLLSVFYRLQTDF